jgi:uncharacterized protein
MTQHALPPLTLPDETETVVPTSVGDLGAVLRVPADTAAPLPGVVLVDGSGDGDRFDWGGWPEWLTESGSIVLRHEKPGCGGSPGHWTDQTLEDRARETLAAAQVLRAHPATSGQPISLYGISQGGWVALLAAVLEPEGVDFVICHSGPGTAPAQQERERIEAWVRADGHDEASVAEAMVWVDARAEMIRRGDPVETILTEQVRYVEEPWYATVSFPYDTVESLRFLAGMLHFDPTTVMPAVQCPVLALFGGADTTVPVQPSVRAFAEHLPPRPEHGFAVFPGANHGLFVADPDPAIPRREQLAPAYLSTIRAFLADRHAS